MIRHNARVAEPPSIRGWGQPADQPTEIIRRRVARPDPATIPITLPAPPPLWTTRRVFGLGLFVAAVVLAVLVSYNLAVGQVISPVPVSCVQEH